MYLVANLQSVHQIEPWLLNNKPMVPQHPKDIDHEAIDAKAIDPTTKS